MTTTEPTDIEILLVDDSQSDCELFRLALQELGVLARLTAMSDGQEAYRLLQVKADSQDMPPPHIIVLDMVLPGMDGSDLCEFIKNHTYVANTPVVMLSNMPETIMKEKLRHADLVSQKPFRWKDFLKLVEQILSLRRPPDDSSS